MKRSLAANKSTVDVERRTCVFVASTEAVDRYGDVVLASGWDLKNFLLNPVILFAHDYDELPVGKAIRTWVENKQLMIEVEFPTKEIYEMADTVFKLVAGDFLNAVSVGFLAKKYRWVDTDDRCGLDIEEAELLEVSIVTVPANPEALKKAAQNGLDKDFREFLRKQAQAAGCKPEYEPEEDEAGEAAVEESAEVPAESSDEGETPAEKTKAIDPAVAAEALERAYTLVAKTYGV